MEFERVYERYFNDVYLFILGISGDAHVAEDVTSDAFFKALRSIDAFRGDCDVVVWLCKIAKNCLYSHYKKARRARSLDDPAVMELRDPAEPIDVAVAGEDAAGRIRTLLHLLPEPYKEVFMWRFYAGLDFRQIGEMYNITDNWACVTYYRARMKLKKSLEEENDEK